MSRQEPTGNRHATHAQPTYHTYIYNIEKRKPSGMLLTDDSPVQNDRRPAHNHPFITHTHNARRRI